MSAKRVRLFVVTGSDTGVGKTVLTALLARHLAAQSVRVAALKPLCSGGRDDAMALQAAAGRLSLQEVNPWHFRAALAPLLAARRGAKEVRLLPVLTHIRAITRRFDWVLVEGAGGVLSPLGAGFHTGDLIRALGAEAIVVVPNRLGAVGQARLVLAALPARARRTAQVVLMDGPRSDAAARTNAALLAECEPQVTVSRLPWLGANPMRLAPAKQRRVTAVLAGLLSPAR